MSEQNDETADGCEMLTATSDPIVLYQALCGATDEIEQLKRERDEARALLMKIHGATCTMHTDEQRRKMRCPICLERERDEVIKQIHEEARDYELELRKLCEAYNDLAERNAKLKAYFIQKSDSAEQERDEAREQNAKLREIAEKAIEYGEKNHNRSCDAISYGGGCECDCGIEALFAELDRLK